MTAFPHPQAGPRSIQRDFEVLVVGAGPAGSFAACRLADLGHEVALVDENHGPRSRIICSGIVSLEAYERFDLPRDAIVDSILDARFLSPSGLELRYRPRWPLAHVVDRRRFDARLTERAVDCGACLLRGRSATSVQISRTSVELAVRVNGEHEILRGRALVVATGYRSPLHKPAGLGRPAAYVQAVHVELPFHGPRTAELYFGRHVAPGFFAWAVPLGAAMARVGLMAPRGGRALLERFLATDAMRPRLALAADNGCRNGLESRVMSRGIVQGPLQPSVADRVVAVGEAAGQVKTTTGGGLYYGLVGAELAAEVLSAALRRGQLSATALYPYHSRWLQRFGPEIEAGLRLQKVAAMLQDHDLDELFRTLQRGPVSGMKRVVRFDWHSSALKLLFRNSHLQRLVAQRMFRSSLGPHR